MKKKNIIYIVVGIIIGILGGYLLSIYIIPTDKQSKDAHQHQLTQDTASETIYTCSMHPQIRQKEPGLCPICEMELVPLKESGTNDPLTLSMTPQAVKIAQLETQKVFSDQETTEGALELSGHISVNEDKVVNEVSYFPGKVERLHVKSKGVYVKEGEKIADVFAPDLRVVQQELISTYQRRDENPELYSAAARKMKYWEIDKDLIMEIAESGIVRSFIPIYAQHSGYITALKVREGDYITRGSKLLELANLSSVWVEFDVNESQLSKVDRGSQVTFSTVAYPANEYTARITYVDPFIDPQSGTAVVRATVPNYGNRFKPNMIAKGYVTFKKRISSSQLLVPASAVLWTGERSVIYVKDTTSDLPSYQYREVKLGAKVRDQYIITEGLNSGEEVVVQGAFSLDAAAQLNNQKSMMNQWVGQTRSSKATKLKLSPPFKESWMKVLEHYIQLKDNLVMSDSLRAQESALQFNSKLKETENKIIKEEVRRQWKKEKAQIFKAISSLGATTSLEEQRLYFKDLSDGMINLSHYYGVPEDVVYVQHCPMAFDDQGADWLSTEEQIRNPYFGDQMLKCGKTLEVIE
jgi:Cu(I)/Ag(I) efflux system membrane fusion protein